MFCSQCGKKLKDTMLFCPGCGAPIETFDDDEENTAPAGSGKPELITEPEPKAAIPEKQEEVPEEELCNEEEEDIRFEEHEPEPAEEEVPVPEMPPIKREPREELSFSELPDSKDSRNAEEEEFVPLDIDLSDEPEEMSWEKLEPKVERRPPVISNRDDDAVRLNGRAPQLGERNRRPAETDSKRRPVIDKQPRAAQTFVPSRIPDPDDLFMDEEDPYDEFDDVEYADLPDDDFEFEDEGESNFFLRHIRGIMGLSLLLLLALVCMIYVFSETGQTALAKMNLAWNPEVYSKVAYEYYENGLYEMSGSFYEKALARDEDNYSYAISAASAYIYADDTDRAASMLKKSISLDPSKAEPYIYLMNIYPDAANRPWDVSQLLQQGYGRTGDDRLKSIAQ
ncbi:MAG: zinc-ribbon domain-containing protein [Clostridia bacterium]|nr:zinc-ribbon domain-containing protein [Clostridia bacterium]